MMERRKNLNDKFGFVDSMKIKDFIDYEQPNEYIVESDRYNSKYSTPVLTAGQSFILGYTNESKGVYEKGPCIIFDDFTTSVHYVDFPFKVKSSAMKILTTKSNANIKYCYYLLLSLSKMPPNHKRQWISTTSEKSYVLPSMDKQISIVMQLDLISDTIANYTNQNENLDNLVKARFIEMFGDPVADTKNWGQTLLKEHLESIKYGTSTPPIFTDDGYAFIRATNIKNGKIVANDMKYIPQEEADRLEKCKLSGGEIIIVRSGVNAGDTCVVTDEYIGQYAGYDMILVLSSDLHPVFFNTLINTEYMDKVVKPLTRRAAQPHLNSEQTQRLPIIEVPFELQKQFADFVQQVDKSRFDIKKSIIELEREVVYD
jgi:type I restriction enzyme S subunit